VVFDANPAINTQNWCNTFDLTNPASHVQPLPASESSANFTVQWTGSDAGSGISDYTIYVSDNGGAYAAWISNSALTQSIYTGVNGHTYRFYSIARDVAGNVEAGKNAAEATTVVKTGAGCASDVSSQFTITRSGFRLNNATKRFQQTVTLTRTATGALAGPFVFAIENLSANATLYSSAGTTTCIAPGSAYLAVNPGNIENQISGQLVQTASRMFKEEVTFNTTNVTSLDWNGYPILRFEECPQVTAVVVQRINERSSGAGEEVMAAAAAAIANAFFDATGVRMQEYPMTPPRVLAALGKAKQA